MRRWGVAATALLALTPVLAHAAPVVRFCPAAQVRTYPLSEQHRVQAFLLHAAAVVNRDGAPFDVKSVKIDLLRNGEIKDRRILSHEDVAGMAATGQAIQSRGLIAEAPFLFCGKALAHEDETFGGPVLARNQALLLWQQVLAYNGTRDQLRITATGSIDGKPAQVTGEIPIRSEFAKTKFLFPLKGVWLAGNAPSFHTPHRWAPMEAFAFDIGKTGASGLSHAGNGTTFADYYAYGADVLAAANGRVVTAHDGEPEDTNAMQRPDESQEAYFARLQKDQDKRIAKGVDGIAGNYIVIDHGGGEYSFYAHLQPGSLRVQVGNTVHAGQPIAKLGSSGNSTEPHLHFQVCDSPDPLMCAGIPVNFTNVTILWADLPRAVQSGDIVVAK